MLSVIFYFLAASIPVAAVPLGMPRVAQIGYVGLLATFFLAEYGMRGSPKARLSFPPRYLIALAGLVLLTTTATARNAFEQGSMLPLAMLAGLPAVLVFLGSVIRPRSIFLPGVSWTAVGLVVMVSFSLAAFYLFPASAQVTSTFGVVMESSGLGTGTRTSLPMFAGHTIGGVVGAMSAAAALAAIRSSSGFWPRVLWALAIPGGVYAAVLVDSRTAYLVVSVAAMIVISPLYKRILTPAGVMIVTVACALLPVFRSQGAWLVSTQLDLLEPIVGRRSAADDLMTFNGRYFIWESLLREPRSLLEVIFGAGPGAEVKTGALWWFANSSWESTNTANTAHNAFLNLYFTSGLLGVGIVLFAIWHLAKLIHAQSQVHLAASRVNMMLLIAFAVGGAFDSFLAVHFMAGFLLLWSLFAETSTRHNYLVARQVQPVVVHRFDGRKAGHKKATRMIPVDVTHAR